MTEESGDDWFPQVDASPSPRDVRPPIEDEWLVGDEPSASAPFDPRSLLNRRVLLPTGILLTFLVALLAAVGVFSSGSPRISAPITPTTATPSVPHTTTSAAPLPNVGIPTTTLKPGDTGPQVKILQQRLASLGYPAGAIDGSYGTATTRAVTAFQRAHGLTPDGIVGPTTLPALGP